MASKKPTLDNPDYQGWLNKEGGNVKNWKKRWFVLKYNKLYYFTDKKKIAIGKEQGVVDLIGSVIYAATDLDNDTYIFCIKTPSRTWQFEASSLIDMNAWMNTLLLFTQDPSTQVQSVEPANAIVEAHMAAAENSTSPLIDANISQPLPDPPSIIMPSQPLTSSRNSVSLTSSRNSVSLTSSQTLPQSPTESTTATTTITSPSTPQTPASPQSPTVDSQPVSPVTTHAPPLTASVSKSVIPTYNSLKQQDVQVRVHVIEARELKGRNMNGQSDPVCFVKMFDETKYTAIHKKTTSCTWDHLFIFQLKLFADEMNAGKINLAVYNANTITRNDLIGAHEVDIMRVYNSPGHELYQIWVALVDTTNEFAGVQGYLKVSITVLRANDPIPAHNTDDDDESKDSGDNLQKMILLPPTIKTEENYFNTRIYRGENIAQTNLLAKPDPFVNVSFAGTKLKTSVAKGSRTPTWNEELKIPVTLPTLSDTIVFQLHDWKAVGSDVLIGTRYLKFSDVLEHPDKSSGPFWINFYGSPYVVAKSTTCENMNKGLIEGTAYRGRVQVELNVQKALTPKAMKVPSGTPNEDTRERMYVVRLDLYEALELRIPAARSLEKIIVKLRWGNNKTQSTAVPSHKAASAAIMSDKKQAYWFENLTELRAVYNPESVPDVFISVCSVSVVGEQTRLGLLRFKPEDMEANPAPKWLPLNPDLSMENEFTKLFSPKNSFGFLLYKLSFGTNFEIQKYPRPQIVRPTMSKYTVRCYIYQGRYLPAADATGLSDPYCIIKVGPLHADTTTKYETLAPHWYEIVELACDLPDDLTLAPAC